VPEESRTIRHPACMLAELPFLVGRLPTITNPLLSVTSAVVRPRPPGHAPGSLFGASDANGGHVPGSGGDFDDGAAGSLQVAVVVEVAYQHVAGRQQALRDRSDGDAVRVDVAVLRHGRRERLHGVERPDERAGGGGSRRSRGDPGHASMRCYPKP
jgi:hypothetical protein